MAYNGPPGHPKATTLQSWLAMAMIWAAWSFACWLAWYSGLIHELLHYLD